MLKRKGIKRKGMTGGKKRQKAKSLSQLKKALDGVFSLWVRKSGNGRCYTCGRLVGANGGQAGHFISRSYLATRWDEDNVRQQCVGCNVFGGGKPLDFEEHLREEIGNKRVDDLKKRRHQIVKMSRAEYETRIEYYKRKML